MTLKEISENNFIGEISGFAVNVNFSQWSLGGEGILVERSDKTKTARMFEEHLSEQMLRVPQPPSRARSLALKN
jgi:hypothetical protein